MTPTHTAFESARQAQTDQAGLDVQTKFASLSSSKMNPEAKAKKLKEACEGFESIFIQKMWQEMRKSVHQSTLLHSREEQFWQDMYDQELAKKMTSAGGIGLADMMFEQLSSHLTSASRATAGPGPIGAFIPSQAPLLAKQDNSPELEKRESFSLPGKAIALYEDAPVDAASEPAPEQGIAPNAQKQAASTIAPLTAAQVAEPKPAEKAKVAASTQVNAEAKQSTSWFDTKPTAQGVDPAIENALASMRANVAANQQAGPLPTVAYAEPHRRQQPVASGLELANAARRQAGDQLGSRGIREPLLPQTERARSTTMAASSRREARAQALESQEEPAVLTERNLETRSAQGAAHLQPLPYSFPRTQAQMQNDAVQFAPMSQTQGVSPSSEAFVQNSQILPSQSAGHERERKNQRRAQRTVQPVRRNRREVREDSIRTLNIAAKPSLREASREGAQFASEMRPLLTPGNAGSSTQSYPIPPLTSIDLKKG